MYRIISMAPSSCTSFRYFKYNFCFYLVTFDGEFIVFRPRRYTYIFWRLNYLYVQKVLVSLILLLSSLRRSF